MHACIEPGVNSAPHLCHAHSHLALVDDLSVRAGGAHIRGTCGASVGRVLRGGCAASACVREARRQTAHWHVVLLCCLHPTCSSWPAPITASLTLFSACMIVLFCCKKEGSQSLLRAEVE